ncbi:MAG TPA: aspartate kinase [Deltaproteobacteria bacterium]|nr:MAG: aspartate kinase [Deltaproteobacteria bacterium GWA2_65_63]OGP38695.1 MAG: aspartate kinase [Deltaproteobacteria bacterium GWC2_66_88]HAM32687.1 aspartate kinase [Deltaproteobacteria bacterium]HBG73591.1 aspartate kinase [Deltaproteobacteria bacterium]
MALIVQKYGGTSVGTVEKIRNVAKRVMRTKEQGNDVVVVVSAMSGETNRLLGLAHQLAELPNERELDVVAATGEQVTIGLLAIALSEMGCKAKSFCGFQIPVLTDAAYVKARIRQIRGETITQSLKDGYVAVVAGFQGIDDSGSITTLGRGGSDTSAVAVAAALKADVCEIYTDVDGVYTTDPNICADARKLDKISFEEMLELASLGAKVLQIRSVEFGMKYGVRIHVRSSFNDHPGTIVTTEEEIMETAVVSGVAYSKNEAKITVVKVPDRPGIAAKIFKPLSEANIVVDVIVQNVSVTGFTDLTYTVGRTDYKKAMQITEKAAREAGAERVVGDEKIAKVSIVGMAMRSHSGVALKVFETLAAEGINILGISTSEIKISVLIEEKYTELAVRVLHAAFGLGNPA